MDIVTSRKNPIVARFRALGADRETRRACGEYLCDGEKLLAEALLWGAEVTGALFSGEPPELPPGCPAYSAAPELIEYASPLKNSPGPLFTVRMPVFDAAAPVDRVLVLDGVQDPGNVGTVLRAANAFGMDAVALLPGCADPFNPKTVRAAMGALFRQRFFATDLAGLRALLEKNSLPLYGAALREDAADIRSLDLTRAAVAVGSEGAGLSAAALDMCDGTLIIPMRPSCESLNAAVAASIIMWEMYKGSEQVIVNR